LALAFLYALPATAQQTASVGVQVLTNSVENDPLAFDVSPPLRDIVAEPVPAGSFNRPVLRPKLQQMMAAPQQGVGAALPSFPGPKIVAIIPLNFDGVGAPNSCNCAPPDTNMAVGDT